MRRVLLCLGTLALLVLLAVPAIAQPAPDEVIVTPPAGPRGTTHTIEFSGTPGETVTMDISFEGQVVFTTQVTVGADGIGVTGVNSEDSDPLGVYEIVITRSDGSTAAGTLEITEVAVEETPPAESTETPPAEQSPEQQADAAVDGDPITPGATVTAVLDESLPAAAYIFRAEAGDTVTIALDSEAFDAYLNLLSADGETLASDDDSGGGFNAAIGDFEIPASGVYIIQATSARYVETDGAFASYGEYALTLTGDISSPAVVQFGDTVTGELTTERPSANYLFSGEAGQLVTIAMQSEDFDPFIALLGPDGTELVIDDDSAGNFNAQITGFTLPAAGEYTIVATTFTQYYNNIPAEGAFTLSVESGLAGDGLVYGDSVEGSYANAAAPDSYLFEGRAGDVVTIALASEDFDPLIILLAPDGDELTRDDDSGDGLNALIAEFELPESGVYTILAGSFNNDANGTPLTGSYMLSLEGEASDVVITEPEQPPSDRALSYGDTVRETLDDAAAGVTYTFEGAAGDVITIDATSDDFDPYLILQDADGAELASDDDSGERLNAQIAAFELPADGTYTIILTTLGNLSNGTPISGTYTLALFEGDVVPVVQTDVTPIAYGDTVEGSLDEAAEGAQYSFTGRAGDVVTIALTSDDFDPYLSLRELDGFELTANDDSDGTLNALISAFELPSDGTYIIVVTSFGNVANGDSITGSYTLTLSSDAEPVVTEPDDPVDPDQEVSPTGLISVGETISAELANSSVGGTYLFEGQAGDVVTILMVSADFDAYLQLTTGSGELLAEDDDSAGDLNALIQGFTLPANGTYRIIATSFNSLTTGVITTGAFSLALAEGFDVPEIETPDTPPEGDLTYGDTIEGELSDSPSGANYSFAGSAGDVVTITLTSSDFDPYVILLNANGDEIASDDDSAGDLNAQISGFALPEDGTYTIVVTSYLNVNTGEAITGSFTLTLESGDAPVVVEPGAGDISYGDTIEGSLDESPAGEAITFAGSEGDVVTITLTSEDFDPFLVLLDEDGEEIAVDDDGAGDLNAQIRGFELPTDGIYTIIVTSFANRSSGTPITGDYTLSLQLGDEVVTEPDTTEIAYGDTVEADLTEDLAERRYTFAGTEGDAIEITLSSDDFDTYLILLSDAGDELFSSDDSGGSTNSQIIADLPYTGDYTIVVTSFSAVVLGETVSGDYVLTLNSDAEPDQPIEIVVTDGGEIESGETVEGELDGDVQAVGYTFEGEAGQFVTIIMDSPDFDPFVYLLDENGDEVISDDDSGGNFNSRIDGFELPEDGEYTVVASSFSARFVGEGVEGIYTLRLTISDEPTPEPVVSGTIADGEVVASSLGGDIQEAEYTFEANAGDRVTILLVSDDFDPFLILLDENGDEVTVDDDSGGEFNSLISDFQLPSAGEYTIIVTSYEFLSGDEASGDFTLSLEIETGDGVTQEPTGAGEIAYGQSVTGALTATTPTVEYRFTGEAGDRVIIAMESGAFDTYLTLYSADNRATPLAADDDSGGGLNSQIGPFTLPEDGDYVIVAGSFSGGAAGGFTLRLSLITEVAVEFGDTTEAELTAEEQTLYFTFSAEAGDVINVVVAAEGDLDTRAALVAPDGFVLAEDDDGGSGVNPEIRDVVVSVPGEYAVILSPYVAGDTGTVEITVERGDLPSLDDGPQVVRLLDKRPVQIVTFVGEPGETVRLRVRALSVVSNETYVTVLQGDQRIAFAAFGQVTQLTFDFVIPADGRVTVRVEDITLNAVQVEITLERNPGD